MPGNSQIKVLYRLTKFESTFSYTSSLKNKSELFSKKAHSIFLVN